MLDERSHRSTFASEFYLWLLATNKIFKSECNQLKRSPFNQCSIQIQATGRPSATAAQLVRSKVEETTLRSLTCTHTCSKRLKGGGRRGRRRRRRLHGGWRRLLRRRSGLALDLAHGERQNGSGRRRRPPSSLRAMVGRGENDRAAELAAIATLV